MASGLLPIDGVSTAALPDMPRRKRFTRSEVERLSEAGVFEGQRYELIEGDLIDKMGQNPPHSWTVALVVAWLADLFGIAVVRCQLPIELAAPDRERNEPEPDVAVLSELKTDYALRQPRGDELLLLVEIADTSSRFDRTVKSALYARASVREYWVIDIPERALYVHRHPGANGYRQVTCFAEEETIAPGAREGAAVRVSELLPPRAA